MIVSVTAIAGLARIPFVAGANRVATNAGASSIDARLSVTGVRVAGIVVGNALAEPA
jgi:hypothetical protein